MADASEDLPEGLDGPRRANRGTGLATAVVRSGKEAISAELALTIFRQMVRTRALEERAIKMSKSGEAYFWIGGPPPSGQAIPGTDFHAVVNRRIAVTPIHLDLTGRRLLRQLKTWTFDLDASTTDIPAADAEATGPIDPPPDEG